MIFKYKNAMTNIINEFPRFHQLRSFWWKLRSEWRVSPNDAWLVTKQLHQIQCSPTCFAERERIEAMHQMVKHSSILKWDIRNRKETRTGKNKPSWDMFCSSAALLTYSGFSCWSYTLNCNLEHEKLWRNSKETRTTISHYAQKVCKIQWFHSTACLYLKQPIKS